jgi:hypothetical protein
MCVCVLIDTLLNRLLTQSNVFRCGSDSEKDATLLNMMKFKCGFLAEVDGVSLDVELVVKADDLPVI